MSARPKYISPHLSHVPQAVLWAWDISEYRLVIAVQTRLIIQGVFRDNVKLWTMRSIVIANAQSYMYTPFRMD